MARRHFEANRITKPISDEHRAVMEIVNMDSNGLLNPIFYTHYKKQIAKENKMKLAKKSVPKSAAASGAARPQGNHTMRKSKNKYPFAPPPKQFTSIHQRVIPHQVIKELGAK